MGIETAIIVGLTAFKMDQQMRQGKREAQAIVEQTNYENQNRAKEIRQRASRVKTSFLNSGLEMSGTVASSIDSIFNTGIEDINRASAFGNRQAKNAISAARTEALSTLVNAGTSMALGSTMNGGITGTSTGGAAPAFQPVSSPTGSFGSVVIGGSAPSSDPVYLSRDIFKGM